jgi:hypothetical protein
MSSLLCASGFATQAHAQTFQVIGPGASSCGTWTADHATPNPMAKFLDEMWVLGFLAGVGDSTPLNPLQGLDANAVTVWVGDYCNAHPLDTILKASESLVKAHRN